MKINLNHFVIKSFFIAATFSILLSSCKKKDDPTPTTVYTSGPVGDQTSLKTGSLVNVDGPGTSGTLAIVQDGNGDQFVKLNSDFMSGFSTGTVVVYLAKTNESIKVQRTAAASNVKAVGFVNSNGLHYLKLPSSFTGYSNVVLYCETAEVNFGYAPLN